MKKESSSIKTFYGADCIAENKSAFSDVHRAFIVTGRRGAAASGALADVTGVLDSVGAEYVLFDRIPENPPLEMCFEAGAAAHSFNADTVIAIGGGSALDAAKAVAAFAANPAVQAEELFDPAKVISPGLPLFAVPTTAGTGSEANPYSILTVDGGRKKRTFKNEWSTPDYAFVDFRYTRSLPEDYTVSCALDALAHSFESYLSPKSTDESRRLAASAAKDIWSVLFADKRSSGTAACGRSANGTAADGIIASATAGNGAAEISPAANTPALAPNTFAPEAPAPDAPDAAGLTERERELLMKASNLAGKAIGITGTGFPHPLGYNLTMAKGIPHGRACAAFYSEYLRLMRTVPEGRRLISELCAYIGAAEGEPDTAIPALAAVGVKLTEDEIADFVSRVKDAGNYRNCPYVIGEDEMSQIYRRLFT